MPTRREFMLTLGALSAGTLAARRRAAARFLEPTFNFAHKPLPNGRGIVIGSLSDGGNVLAVNSDNGPIVIDAKFAHTGRDLFADVKSQFSAAPALLINTHHHADHSGGNWVFNDNGVKTTAHQNFNVRIELNRTRYRKGAEEYLAELRNSGASPEKIAAAQADFDKIKLHKAEHYRARQALTTNVNVLNAGGVEMHVFHYGNGHTDNDLVVFFPRLNVLHMGDLIFNNLHPFIDRPAKAHTRDWQYSIKQAMKLGDDETIVIPGHGEVTDKTALARQVEYFDQLRDIVHKAMKEGQNKESIAQMKPEAFKGYGFEGLLAQALSAVYEEIGEVPH